MADTPWSGELVSQHAAFSLPEMMTFLVKAWVLIIVVWMHHGRQTQKGIGSTILSTCNIPGWGKVIQWVQKRKKQMST